MEMYCTTFCGLYDSITILMSVLPKVEETIILSQMVDKYHAVVYGKIFIMDRKDSIIERICWLQVWQNTIIYFFPNQIFLFVITKLIFWNL